MAAYDDIRFFEDDELEIALKSAVRHPMIKSLFQYTFPDKDYEEIQEIVLSCRTIDDFQRRVIYVTAERVLETTSAGLTTEGLQHLSSSKNYLFLSNHRDILLDTVILNVALFDHDLKRTASAIGDNLVQKPFLEVLAKLNRNFLVKRNLGPRQMLRSSIHLATYIQKLLFQDEQSVWLAHREGRTKNGDDRTQQGVLKMLDLARAKDVTVADYFNSLNIVPVSISYEYDPTDALKVPELVAKQANQKYIKTVNEDFSSIMKGALGQKKRIHLAVDSPMSFNEVLGERPNETFRRMADQVDKVLHANYKLWPTNYVAADMMSNGQRFADQYTATDKEQFRKRMAMRTNMDHKEGVSNFLKMYAKPVFNSLNQLVEYDN